MKTKCVDQIRHSVAQDNVLALTRSAYSDLLVRNGHPPLPKEPLTKRLANKWHGLESVMMVPDVWVEQAMHPRYDGARHKYPTQRALAESQLLDLHLDAAAQLKKAVAYGAPRSTQQVLKSYAAAPPPLTAALLGDVEDL